MVDRTLLDIVRDEFGFAVDPDSDGGQMLNSMVFNGQLTPERTGKAQVDNLTISPTPRGVSIRAAQANDAMVFNLPGGEWDFSIVPPAPNHASLFVEITLVAPKLKLPFLRPAILATDGTLDEGAPGDVRAIFPKLLLLITATPGNPDATAKLAPSHDATGALEVTFEPLHVLFGAGSVLGLGLPKASLDLEAPGGSALRFLQLELFVDPPGIPALSMRGGGTGLVLEFGNGGGLSGDFNVTAAGGEFAEQRPRFLHNVAAHLKLDRNSIMLLELTGQIALSDEIRRFLGESIEASPGDIDYRLALALDDGWKASLQLASSGGADYLWRSQRGQPHAPSTARDTLGAYAVFAPIFAPSLPGAGSSGYVDLALGGVVAGSLVGSEWITSQQVTVFGAELIVASPAAGPPEGIFLFDVETELNVNAKIGAGTSLLKTKRALKVRQRAVGLRLDFGPDGSSPQLKPVFDPLQGFNLDLSDPGTFDVPPPLGEFLQPDSARMARDNPLVFEVDLVTKADLGVVTIDRASVRVPLDGRPPTLTGLGAHLDMGLVKGSGYIRLLPSGIDGGFDANLAALGVRVGARLQIESQDDLVSLLVGLNVEWPIPIPLANSGLGLFGFLGLLGVNRRRKQEPNQNALDWLKAAPEGDPARGAWEGSRGAFALGLGAVIGTLEGGFLFNAKGMLMIELPGPRLLIVMKANIMLPRPPKGGTSEGTLLAVIEISDDGITIGIIIDYRIPFLLELRVPVETHFDFNVPANWYFDVGSIEKGVFVSIKFMSSIRADGYFMIHGNGIKSPLHQLEGFSVAAGIQAAMTWGPVAIGLYIKVAVGADVGISFKPILMIGRITLEGELHLFIISIGVRASALLKITADSFYVRAEIEGHVDFFFFEVSASVTFELGDENLPLPAAEPLLRAMSLHSRSHALLPGQGADQAVDGSLGDASPGDGLPGLVVPIDAIPVLQFEMRAHVKLDVNFLGQAIPSLLPADGWVRRGERFYRYEVQSVTLSATNADGVPHATPTAAGETPVVWWDKQGNPAAHDDSDVQLALLSWTPDPTPAAALRTETRDKYIKDKWGTICDEVAEETGVLWTFLRKAPGPSTSGWTLVGIPYPDPPGTTRSSPPSTIMTVSEPWRSGTLADALVNVLPAYVLASTGIAARLLIAPKTRRKLMPRVEGDPAVDQLLSEFPQPDLGELPDTIRLDTSGMRQIRALVFVPQETGRLLLRARDSNGKEIGFEVDIEPDYLGFSQLPRRWNDPSGPWAQIVSDMYAYASDGPTFTFFDITLLEGTACVDIGLIYYSEEEEVSRMRRWGLLAVEVVTEAEYARKTFDETRKRNRVEVVDGALGADQSKRALLHPNSIYTVAVDYAVAMAMADDKGHLDPKTIGTVDAPPQVFRFRTDVEPPKRLDSLVMATAPDHNEESYFYRDPVRVVFSTGETRKLFKAYGRDLFAVVKAASGKHPRSTPDLDLGIIALDGPLVSAVPNAAVAVPPFERSIRDALVEQPCINLEFVNNRHEIVTINLELEPTTGYTLDMEARPNGGDAAPVELYPLLRRSFRTSRYADAQDFANDLRAREPKHRHLQDVSALLNLPSGAIADLALETALRAVGWGELGRATAPRKTVIWTGAAGIPAQAVAVLVESPERHWRYRPVPEERIHAGVRSYVLGAQQWLDVIDQSDPQTVGRLVHTTDGARTLAILHPNARGKVLHLALRRTHHPLYEGDAARWASTFTSFYLTPPWEQNP
ncbi:hypothetical protein [Mesorhizobium sp.]|uniref:hypothetical protein n=1 Tax=Mesorhizobium sp. TaxID=1871066 RepID=UPI000FE68AA7|nr:hypothetical protein [Mesorhizobium sp.]RWP30700.1 MAG: hypothetical protein EOR03_24270 [Mesorhizobium sp.]